MSFKGLSIPLLNNYKHSINLYLSLNTVYFDLFLFLDKFSILINDMIMLAFLE